jgi:uncharacterized protein YfaS (alpha-2-macroglobulin family)
MRIKTVFALLIMGTAVFVSCNKKNAVSLSYTNAKDEVPQLGNLNFRFNHSLIPNDSLLNIWDSTEYISFEPAIHGRFRWESPDELVFSPSHPLDPATDYTATIKKAVLKYSKYSSVGKGDKISFHTAPLALENAQVLWTGEGASGVAPQLDLYFNYKVNPADIKDKLSVEIEGTPASTTFISETIDNKVSIKINGLKQEDKDLTANISIGKGLKPESGRNATTDPIKSTMVIPSPYVLTIQNIEAEHDGVDGIVKVLTSQQLNNESIKSFLKFNPELNFTVQLLENGFELRSDKFDVERSYDLTITKGLRGKIGGTLKEDYNGSVAFGELEPNVNFTNSKAVYLSKLGGKNVEVQLTNVPKVKVIISKIYENNLLLAQRYGYYPQEKSKRYASYSEEEGDEDSYYYEDYSTGYTLGDVIYEKEIDTRSLPKSGAGRLLNIAQFEDRLPDFKGIYHILIRSMDKYWVRDSRYISLSDIGLITKEGEDKVFVFANSIKTSKSMAGVNVAVYGANNQLIGSAPTNAEGVAEIPCVQKEFGGFNPAMVIAKTDDDFNYLPFSNTRVNTSRFDVGGKRNNPSGLDAFVYAERDIYRPGERVNFSVVIRDREWKSPGEIPLKINFLLPNGKELKSIRKTLNEEGSIEGNLDISGSAITGSYSMEVYTSNDVLLATKNFSVEEFVPDRIRVNTKLDKQFLRPGEVTKLSINAMNFFGPPAANRNYETEIQIKQKNFSTSKFEDFDFSLSNTTSMLENKVMEGKTDEQGNAAESFDIPAGFVNNGVLQANFYTTVFDETGRPVSKAASIDIYTQDVQFGIKRDWYYYYPLNQAVRFELAAVSKDGNASRGTARVEIWKQEYRTVLVRSGSHFRYESQTDNRLLSESTLEVGANTVYSYVPRSPGDYEIRISRPGAGSYVKRNFYSYGSWGMTNTSFEVNTEGNIDIDLEKKSYFSGETVKAIFKTPFSGRMLVTLERDKVISYQYVEVTNRTASLDLKLDGKHVPNVYITATLIKPHEFSDIPLTVATGFQNVKVEEKSRLIPVEILAEKSVRSKTSQTIRVKASPGSYVTLAAVDNGVLQVTNFQTPDPYNYFYQKRALQVSAYNIYPLLFAELRARLSSTGGDGELDMTKRTNPMPAKRIKVVSYWSGIKKADGNGQAEFKFDIPQFSGELRLMAVSYKGQCFGGAENTMTVADPIVISTALPRFLSPGDTVNVPVTISNTTAKASNVTASLQVNGSLRVLGNNNQTVSLGAKSEGRANFSVVANSSIGVGQVNVSVKGMGETFTDNTEISVRPPSTLQKVTESGSIAGGSNKKINIGLRDFIEGSTDYKLVISRSPALELGEHLRYLVQYPYGCTEQTVSAAFPQLYYGDMADLMQLNKQGKLNANSNIMEAIRKIKMRQLYSGAVTLWDGEGTEDWWATVYSAHFLLEAKKAGFDVDDGLLSTMLNYLNNRLRNKETINYYYNRDQQKKIAPKEVAYSLYVLAQANRSNVSTMNYYKANSSLLALDSRYLLSAAYAIAGDKKSFAALLPTSFSGEESVPQTGGSYYSDVRDEAIALNALIDTDPSHPQISVMARHVQDKLKTRRYLSTQERSFAFLALGKLARSAGKSDVSADVMVNGKVVAHVEGGQWKGDKAALKSNNVEIVTKGNGRLYYFWEAEGISSSGGYKEEDSYLKVRKRFYNRFGQPITGNTFKQNDLVVVAITLERSYSTNIENVVITDLLPAGFEIENPRTKEIPGMDWIKDASTPTALDVRDDRIHFFVDANESKKTYYYAVRAVSPGNYKMGPVSADAMYNGEYHSYHGAGVIRVEGR